MVYRNVVRSTAGDREVTGSNRRISPPVNACFFFFFNPRCVGAVVNAMVYVGEGDGSKPGGHTFGIEDHRVFLVKDSVSVGPLEKKKKKKAGRRTRTRRERTWTPGSEAVKSAGLP